MAWQRPKPVPACGCGLPSTRRTPTARSRRSRNWRPGAASAGVVGRSLRQMMTSSRAVAARLSNRRRHHSRETLAAPSAGRCRTALPASARPGTKPSPPQVPLSPWRRPQQSRQSLALRWPGLRRRGFSTGAPARGDRRWRQSLSWSYDVLLSAQVDILSGRLRRHGPKRPRSRPGPAGNPFPIRASQRAEGGLASTLLPAGRGSARHCRT